jgi:hypothetical protein
MFCQIFTRKNKDVKELIWKEFFNYSEQKKVINRAARDSAADQRELLDKYKDIVRISSQYPCSR